MRDTRVYLLVLIVSGVLLAAPTAQANHRTDLTSAADEGDPYDANVTVGYTRTLHKGSIKRESLGQGRKGGSILTKQLTYANIRHTLSVRADLAIFRDLQVHLEIPIIISDSRMLKLAENGGDSCGNPPSTHCVTPSSLDLISDGFMPNAGAFPNAVGAMVGSNDSPAGGFQLPNRSGLDQIHVGLTWAPLNQNRDATKPTWIIGFEARVAVGETMRYTPWVYDKNTNAFSYSEAEAKKNTAVGQGLHHFHFFMTLSRRFKYVDPWFTLFYFLPVAVDDSLYAESSFDQSGQERHLPQMSGGVESGIQIIPWEDKERDLKVAIDVWARLTGMFEGRGYSPMWEVFSQNPVLNGPCRRTAYDISKDNGYDKWQNGTYCGDKSGYEDQDGPYIPYPGITSIENHAVFKGGFNVNAQLTKWFWVMLGVGLGHEQAHFITFGDTGINRAACERGSDGARPYNCNNMGKNAHIEPFYPAGTDNAADVNSGKRVSDWLPYDELNPVYRPYIDLAGRRYRVTDSTIFDVMVAVKGMF